jgi:hypothetical protein
LVVVTKNEAECVTSNLKGKISAEYVVKQCERHIRGLLMHIYDFSFKSDIFWGKFKIARVKLLNKKGYIHNVQNFIPLSVLTVFSKILEMLMCNRLTAYLNRYYTLLKAQNVHMENKSTNTVIQSFSERIQEGDSGLHAIGIFCDITKAYNVLYHG